MGIVWAVPLGSVPCESPLEKGPFLSPSTDLCQPCQTLILGNTYYLASFRNVFSCSASQLLVQVNGPWIHRKIYLFPVAMTVCPAEICSMLLGAQMRKGSWQYSWSVTKYVTKAFSNRSFIVVLFFWCVCVPIFKNFNMWIVLNHFQS